MTWAARRETAPAPSRPQPRLREDVPREPVHQRHGRATPSGGPASVAAGAAAMALPASGMSGGRCRRRRHFRADRDLRQDGADDALGVSPVLAALRSRMIRWASTASATLTTSSGSTKSRPSSAAVALAARSSCSMDRGLAPSRSSPLSRVARPRATVYSLIGLGDVDLLHRGDHRGDLAGGDHGGDLGQRGGRLVCFQHFHLGLLVRVAHGNPCHEPVPLGLRERVRALHFNRVLRGHHHKRLIEFVGLAVHGDLVLLHALQQGRLGLGRGAVDFVADDDVGEHRAGPELEGPGRLVVDGHARDVGREQVRGELDPADRTVDGAGKSLGQQGLAHPGDVLQEQVALGQQHGQGQFRRFGLAVDHRVDGGQDALAGGAGTLPRPWPGRLGRVPGRWKPGHGGPLPEVLALGEDFV